MVRRQGTLGEVGSVEKGACISGAASGSCLRYSVTCISVERARGSPKSGCEVWPGVWDLGGVGSRSAVLTVTCQSFLLGGPAPGGSGRLHRFLLLSRVLSLH